MCSLCQHRYQLTHVDQMATDSVRDIVFNKDIFISKSLDNDVFIYSPQQLATENWPAAKQHKEVVYFQFAEWLSQQWIIEYEFKYVVIYKDIVINEVLYEQRCFY